MIVRDEEEFLGDCLESVRGIVDEIVIVDTGSTDGTLGIARGAGARIVQEHWHGDFSEARNRSLAACTGTWILYLDADERLAPGQSDKIRALLANRKVDAYQVLVRSVLSLDGGKKATQVMPYPRLFRKKEGVLFERSIHEQIAPSILRNGGKIVPADLVIEHIGYDRGFDALKKKVRRTLGPLLAIADQDSGDWYARFQLARSFMLVQDYPAVVHYATSAMRIPGVPTSTVSSLHNLLAEVALKTRNVGQAIRHCEKSLTLTPNQAGALWFLAGSHMTQGNPRLAIPVLENLVVLSTTKGVSPATIDDLIIPADAVHEALGRCYFAIGSWERAAEAYASALRANLDMAGVGQRLIAALQKLGQPAIALRCLRMATEGMTKDVRLLSYRAMVENEAGHNDRADETIDRVLALRPADPLALSWKALWAMQRKDYQTASAVLKTAEEHAVKTDDLARCAFELAVHEGRYDDAQSMLEKTADLYSPADYRVLAAKVAKLAHRERSLGHER